MCEPCALQFCSKTCALCGKKTFGVVNSAEDAWAAQCKEDERKKRAKVNGEGADMLKGVQKTSGITNSNVFGMDND